MLRFSDLGFGFRAKCWGLISNFRVLSGYVCYCLSSSKGAVSGINYVGDYYRVIQADTRKLDCSSCIAEIANLSYDEGTVVG